jgi:hypothetical protein
VSSGGAPRRGWRCDRFFERVALDEMRRIYSSCDVLLKLSRIEGFFGPPMEMMACGGNVVVGRVTGHDEYVVDGENALVVDPLDVPAARDAVRRLLTDRALAERLRAGGLATARSWPWDASIDVLEAYFRDVLAGRRGKVAAKSHQAADRSLAALYAYATGIPVSGDGDVLSPAEHLGRALARRRSFQALARLVWRPRGGRGTVTR